MYKEINLKKNNGVLIILGPTATGKTNLAVEIASNLNGEIISADSRQVYKGLDIGTGKDLEEYILDDKSINHHLIDIINPNENYSVYSFQRDFISSYKKIINKIYNDGLNEKGLFIMGIDHYAENSESLDWGTKFNLDITTLSINEWVGLCKQIGFNDVQFTQVESKENWKGTLIIKGTK